MSDHTLEKAVMQALADNRRVHPDEIAVQAIDGTVILRGTVGTLVQQVEAARTARHVLGVQSVEDQLRVRPLGIDGRADADTRAAVLAALIDDDELHAADIDVDANDGTVTLSGLVEFPGARDRAERIALGVGGVTSVHNRLKVLVPVPLEELRLPADP
jgi:hyperosmotically inducible periplasmic protein